MPKPLNVLILEDNPADAELLLIELRRAGYDPTSQIVDNEKDFSAHLKPELDLILSDYSLPQFNGLQALQLLNASGYDIPFIIVSGTIGEEVAVESIHQGADDYLMKDRMKRLDSAVTNAIKKKELRDDKRQSEQALRESEERYRSVVEDSPGLISRFLPDGTITFVNQEYCRFFGRKYDEVIGTNVQSTITEENKEIVMSSFDSISAESPIRSIEVKNITQDGETFWIRWTDHALFNEKGQVIGYQSFGEDITERKRAEDLLKQEQGKAQKYLDIAEVIMIALNLKGEITLINQKGNRILGYQEDELIGKNWFDTCAPERERKERRQVFRKIIAGEAELDVYDNEHTVLTRSGEERTIAWQDTVIWDEKGHNVGSLSSGEDITERKRIEQAILLMSDTQRQVVLQKESLGIYQLVGKKI